MEAKELMVGDWILDKQKKPIQCEIINDNDKCINEVYCQGDIVDEINETDIEPIPLTEEIFKLNGFTTDNDHTLMGCCIYHKLCGKNEDYKVTVRLLNGWVKIESFDDRMYTLLDLAIQPRYVHELQHALRLCGLTDLADNFKVV